MQYTHDGDITWRTHYSAGVTAIWHQAWHNCGTNANPWAWLRTLPLKDSKVHHYRLYLLWSYSTLDVVGFKGVPSFFHPHPPIILAHISWWQHDGLGMYSSSVPPGFKNSEHGSTVTNRKQNISSSPTRLLQTFLIEPLNRKILHRLVHFECKERKISCHCLLFLSQWLKALALPVLEYM